RWSRMLANIWLRVNKGELIEWPEATIGSVSAVRAEYLDAVRSADQVDIAKLLALHQRFQRRG
ncbi:MAG: hypothetical protein AABZ53_12420, partial [Planctomycetota bacterium]